MCVSYLQNVHRPLVRTPPEVPICVTRLIVAGSTAIAISLLRTMADKPREALLYPREYLRYFSYLI